MTLTIVTHVHPENQKDPVVIFRLWQGRFIFQNINVHTLNPLYHDIRYNSKIHYNVNSVCTKISGSSIILFFFSLGKYMFWIFVRIASPRRF